MEAAKYDFSAVGLYDKGWNLFQMAVLTYSMTIAFTDQPFIAYFFILNYKSSTNICSSYCTYEW